MKKNTRGSNAFKKQEPIAKKTKEIIGKSVLNSPRDSRAKKFPKNLPDSHYVAISSNTFKEMQNKKEK